MYMDTLSPHNLDARSSGAKFQTKLEPVQARHPGTLFKHIDALEMGTSEKVARNDMEEKAKILSCVSLETQKYCQTRRDGHITGSKIQKQHGVGNKDIEWGVAGDSEISPITLCVRTTSEFQKLSKSLMSTDTDANIKQK
ncbi:hypothetical protein DFH07DRAFT_784326 [Mycena maculata]|uniref:Uncharacterized protein n=1 Tax=Mycena maculata TaxID=230809 RepID=A0AAD7HIK5_9AGAR|nr:hypothetical protein DFH07DRAFT_784326 [Mycena maculata]